MERRLNIAEHIMATLIIICAFLLLTTTVVMKNIDELSRVNNIQDQKIKRLERRISTYEKRTTDVLDNWDSMRKTQLTLMNLYYGEGK